MKLKEVVKVCVGKNIKNYLDSHGITQSFLSDKTKIPISKLNNMLHGKRKITAEEYISICKALGVPYEFFDNSDISQNMKKG